MTKYFKKYVFCREKSTQVCRFGTPHILCNLVVIPLLFQYLFFDTYIHPSIPFWLRLVFAYMFDFFYNYVTEKSIASNFVLYLTISMYFYLMVFILIILSITRKSLNIIISHFPLPTLSFMDIYD